MYKILQIISQLKIPTDIIMGMAFFISLFLIFMPNTIINKMGLNTIVSEHISVISFVCLVSIFYFVSFVVKACLSIISIFLISIRMRNNLSKLSNAEKRLLLFMYENDYSATLDLLNPTVGMLLNKGLIYRCSNIGLGTEFPFALQPYVIDYINKYQTGSQ